MTGIYTMRVLIDEDMHPDLYAELSKAKHPRARAEMLRRLASEFLKQQSSTHVPSEQGSTAQSQVRTPASEARQPRTTRQDDPKTIARPAPATPDGLSLPANMSSALVAGVGKYLS